MAAFNATLPPKDEAQSPRQQDQLGLQVSFWWTTPTTSLSRLLRPALHSSFRGVSLANNLLDNVLPKSDNPVENGAAGKPGAAPQSMCRSPPRSF